MTDMGRKKLTVSVNLNHKSFDLLFTSIIYYILYIILLYYYYYILKIRFLGFSDRTNKWIILESRL